MDVGIEKRKFRREKSGFDVHCVSFGIEDIFVSRDCGAGGLFLNTPSPLPPGSEVALSFNVSPEGPEIACPGRVVYALPGVGMGIEFLDARHEIEMALDQPGFTSH